MNFHDDDGACFESLRSSNQELTFDALKHAFRSRNMEFSEQKLKLTGSDGSYRNLALLLSDQCAHTVKLAVFQGEDTGVFRDRCEFTGSLARQMSEIYEFLNFRNAIRATFSGLYRNDVRDYPETAMREALLNLLTHRDYSSGASALIRLYSNRLEFVSPGGLMPRITPNDLMMGISFCRNHDLAEVFHTLPYVDAYGVGITRIMQAYEDCMRKPAIEVTADAFKLILPNVNAVPVPTQEDRQSIE